MKKIIIALLAVMAAVGCANDTAKYVIKGSGLEDGANVQLVDQITSEPIDSAVVAGGVFQLKGKAAKDAFLFLASDASDWRFPLFNDGTPVEVNFGDNTVTAGSELNLKLAECDTKTSDLFEGHDAPLCLIQAYWMLRGMIILKDRQTPAWGEMVRRAILPVIDRFEAYSPYANGNWGHIVNRCRMACGIFLDDKELYQHAVDVYLHAKDDGSLPGYVAESGQCQETGRDQGHAQLGLGAMCEICEMAWGQGDDLWGALDNRLMKGIEYTAKYNLGNDVPFETWTDWTGLYNDWTEPGEMGRGRIRCIYDLPYAHYVGRKGLKMPYTKKVLALQAKAEKNGEMTRNPEADQFSVKGVKEGARLHSIFTYPAPEGAPLKHDYEVYLQPRGHQEWTRIDTYMAKVNAPVGDNKHKVSEISYCFFDFTGDVNVRVVTKNKKFTSARVRPDYRGCIAQVKNDSTVQFLLFQPENVSVEFDGDITDNLLVFTSKPPVSLEEAREEAEATGRSFHCYGPGFSIPTKPFPSPPTPSSIWPAEAISRAPLPSRMRKMSKSWAVALPVRPPAMRDATSIVRRISWWTASSSIPARSASRRT